MKVDWKRYRGLIVVATLVLIMTALNVELGMKAMSITSYSLKEMLLVIPPIFVLLGLLDVWVPREQMVRYMGEGSGMKGVLLSIFIGSAAAGPLYGAFPVAAIFMKKGVKFNNVLIIIGAWSTTKIPMLLFEIAALGPQFALTRLLVNIPGIVIIAAILSRLVTPDEVRVVYRNAESFEG